MSAGFMDRNSSAYDPVHSGSQIYVFKDLMKICTSFKGNT